MKTILLIEDDTLMMKIMIKILSGQNYLLDTAFDGKQAFQKLDYMNYSFDLVITDILMPYSNGFEIVSKIKEHPRQNNMPVIMISAINNEEIMADVYKVGANDYLRKPLKATDLLTSVRTLLN